ncbi:putative oxidoreductase, nitronate monooxygenase family [Olavius algarvensis associated proteobacterium Delta 3]|nr:putative oxidoreductase, nitronate monooxygenase family [Olavius algarvensis associated proteobacterium Delta 3]CAB5156350.1 putative oxidoreductase, nitronate monooxygenase family [Olavius algarvensis associated proteobacterium Delta 3]
MNMPSLKIGSHVSTLPIIQGGMGVGISLSGLSSAVANQGGIGVIAAAMPGIHEPDIATDPDGANIRVLKREIRRARKKMTRGVLGVNIMVALTNFGDMVRTSIEEGIDIIFAGAGLPLDLPSYLPDGSKTSLVPIVSSGRAAMILCKKWLSRFDYLPDGFVVEGPKAGGHIGFKSEQIDDPAFSLEHLVLDVIEAVKPFEARNSTPIPVISAGGIFTGRDIHRFLEVGAAGVQMGTRFVATHECDADEAFKQVYVASTKEDMVIIKSPVGLPGRAVQNSFLDEVSQGKRKPFKCPYHCIKTCNRETSPYCIAIALGNARKGRFNRGFAFAGKNAYRIQEIISVKELMDSLKEEYFASLEQCTEAVITSPSSGSIYSMAARAVG